MLIVFIDLFYLLGFGYNVENVFIKNCETQISLFICFISIKFILYTCEDFWRFWYQSLYNLITLAFKLIADLTLMY